MMKYNRAEKYDQYMELMMGPNPVKLEEELMKGHKIPQGATVMDLGCGRGLTSLFLVKEYGFRVFATDLWCSPTENKKFFDRVGLSSEQIIPLRVDANELPFAGNFFDAVISIDSYHYFGRDPRFLSEKILPVIKHGGYLYIAIPGMKKDCHHDLPQELLLAWDAEQLDFIHDISYWRNVISQTEDAEIISIHEMQSTAECWQDWIQCNNEYAKGDRKIMEAGGGKYLNFIAIILKRR